MKTPPENNPTELPLPGTAGTKPITRSHATAAQIAAALGFDEIDDPFLRNRVRDGLIPKPRNSLYNIDATTIGILKFYRSRAATKSELPAQYPSMQAMAGALGVSVKAIKWILKNGAAEAQDDHHRVTPLPIVRRAFEIIAQVADGHVTGLDGFEQWNHQTELAKKLRQETEKLEDEKLLRKGEMLLARDASFALSKMAVDELLWEKLLQPARAGTLKLPPAINRQHKTILKEAGTSEDAIRKCAAVVMQTVAGLLDKLRAKIPTTKTDEEKSE